MTQPFITLTGANASRPLNGLSRIDAEIGLLYTFDPEGRNRYPSYKDLLELARSHKRVALHVCGARARSALTHRSIDKLIKHVQRIQVNGILDERELYHILSLYPDHTIITQHHTKNTHLLSVRAPNHALLVDGSGGAGKSPDQWVAPKTTKAVGFAGGLGPDNLASELVKIKVIARPGWWVDMEQKLRTDDWFDVQKARQCADIFKANV